MLKHLFFAFVITMGCLSQLQANEEPKKTAATEKVCPNDKCVAEEVLACKDCG